MWRRSVIAIAVWIGTVWAQSDPFEPIEYTVLNNGLKVYLFPDQKSSSTQISVEVGVGTYDETREIYGLSHLVEHLVFRDARVPYRDYSDYLKDEGATYVNGYTRRFTTEYTATIDANRSYWLVETFASMLFDKNVTREDLEAERGALQTEIGEPYVIGRLSERLKRGLEAVFPPEESFFKDWFGLEPYKQDPPHYVAQQNNMRFTLNDVMRRYRDYYYPANMTVSVAGGFDKAEMLEVLRRSFGAQPARQGATTPKPADTPRLPSRPYRRYWELGATGGSRGSLGGMYVLDDYAKYVILDAYSEDLAERLQRRLRNKSGTSYSVSAMHRSYRNAGVAGVSFDGTHDNFEQNLQTVYRMIEADYRGMSEETVRQALQRYYKLYFTALEHDSDTLMRMIGAMRFLREDLNVTDGKTPYDFFTAVTPKQYNATVHEMLDPKRRYEVIVRNYHFFPFDTMLLGVVGIVAMLVLFFQSHRFDMKRLGVRFTQRDVVFSRRLSARFSGFLVGTTVLFVTTLLWEWIIYGLSELSTGDGYVWLGIAPPWSYAVTMANVFGYVLFFIWFYRKMWRYNAKLLALPQGLLLVGNRLRFISKEQIAHIDIVPRMRAPRRTIAGIMWRFWKPLTALRLKDGTIIHLRTDNAVDLREDIEAWLRRKED